MHSLAMDIFGEEYSQMFSLVDGVREQALADSRMTDFAKSQVLCRESAFVCDPNANVLLIYLTLIGTKRL